ncbi:UDP-2,4-diacetamido-2,4,6-trideoxy-beta-L-altropyranose hydrolase [Alkalibacillus filiformis]|uniref:UDP-2,4-diacetamido-2,4, 6-trideoxy-beta-L-altropyranose hydrolase n=1 Tax=Alkalibacillus filiformis TaxID=200990 RepID=A0ABU0DP66_9BACI|nr:UDP-2,4-diacetamido-2,4,6-trideoxy-beta-L-altropyranose hydrolase [Alkalibacillus filiformis]MDQ0350239.1 UDP-2,4-diacetamido-2,4,6-trideoxy-beta-L-altropyranose hydrolase [Alkalibacillus filiformis]
MNIVIRTDASRQIGSGHVMRCITLAEQLQKRGATITFICSRLKGHLIEMIRARGFRCESLTPTYHWLEDARATKAVLRNKTVDWVIIDHYSIDVKWEREVRPYTRKIMVIDDLANREHDCDLLLDYQVDSNHHYEYESLIPKNAIKLLGTKFLILRPEFYQARKQSKVRKKASHLLVAMGGTDPTGETLKVLQAIDQVNQSIDVDVVIGHNHPHQKQIEAWCDQHMNATCHIAIHYMADLMQAADFAIGAGGTSTYERAFLGLPAIVIETASNQTGVIQGAESLGIIESLGTSETVTISAIAQAIEHFIQNTGSLQRMSESAFSLFPEKNHLEDITKWILGGD